MIDKEEIENSKRISKVLSDHGYNISWEKAHDLWERLSEIDYCAGWLILPKDDESLWKIIERFKERNII